MYEYVVKEVYKIVDGDTIDVVIDVGFNIFTLQRIRLAGIDAPELHTRNAEEKEHAIKAKGFVIDFFEDAKKNNYQITIKTTLDDKYGRMLGRVVANAQCLNDLLLTNHLAFPYHGERKIPYSERLEDQ